MRSSSNFWSVVRAESSKRSLPLFLIGSCRTCQMIMRGLMLIWKTTQSFPASPLRNHRRDRPSVVEEPARAERVHVACADFVRIRLDARLRSPRRFPPPVACGPRLRGTARSCPSSRDRARPEHVRAARPRRDEADRRLKRADLFSALGLVCGTNRSGSFFGSIGLTELEHVRRDDGLRDTCCSSSMFDDSG